MLEQASTYLDTGGRRLFRNPKRCLRSRRMLHSTLWCRDASALNLPAWRRASPIIDRTVHNAEVATEVLSHRKALSSQTGPLLDFLYPIKTLAILQRIANNGTCHGGAQRKCHPGRSGARQFSTTQWRAIPEDPTLSDSKDGKPLDTEDEKSSDTEDGKPTDTEDGKPTGTDARKLEFQLHMEMQQRLVGSTAVDALKDLLASGARDKFELAWRLYSAIEEEHRTPQLDINFLICFGSPSTRVQALRVLQVFDALGHYHRKATSIRAAVSAHLFLGQLDEAVKLHDELEYYHSRADLGTGLILARTVEVNDWKLSLQVFQTFFRNTQKDNLDYLGNWVRSGDGNGEAKSETVWGEVSKLPYVRGNLESFLLYLGRSEQEGSSFDKNSEGVRMFLEGLAREAMEQVLHADPPNEDTIWDFFLSFFQTVTRLGLPTNLLYEYAIRRFVDTPRYQKYTNQRKPWLQLYIWFRNSAWGLPPRTAESEFNPYPSRKLIRQLMYQVGRHQSAQTSRDKASVATLIADHEHFYPVGPFPFSTLKFLLHFYAKRGEAEKVHEVFNEIRKNYPEQIDLHILSSLTYVYARRVDPKAAEEQFKRISNEFGHVPNTECWNVLLVAYTRADDLDGSLACFNRILQAGAIPTLYTVTPLLDLCASRADVEAFETIFSKAEQLKIDLRGSMWARLGYVRACLLSNDPEGAEAIADTMRRNNKAGTLPGELTSVWNALLEDAAVKGDIFNTRRLYQQMIQYKIPLDTWTYASVMRALVQVHQTNAAFKIVRVTMPENNVRVHAFHYALLMTGFLRERQYSLAMRAYERMCMRNVEQTYTSRMTSLQVLGMTELRSLASQKPDNPHQRLVEVERALRDIVVEDLRSGIAHSGPRLSRNIDSREHLVPSNYLGLLILLYGTRGAYDICNEMFEAAKLYPENNENFVAPIELLIAIMKAHNKAKEHDEVAKCFELARSQADSLVKTLQTAMSSSPVADPESDSITDPALVQQFQESKIAPNRRQIMAAPARIYIDSLLSRKDPTLLQEARRTVRSLLASGYVIDNMTWNKLVQALARHGHVLDAFSACEMYLMPNFPGWRKGSVRYIRRNIKGHQYMDLRHYDVGNLINMPRYKTLLVLAAAFTQIKRGEADGVGFNPDLGGWTSDALKKMAPRTMEAIETMPRVKDKMQKRWLETDF